MLCLFFMEKPIGSISGKLMVNIFLIAVFKANAIRGVSPLLLASPSPSALSLWPLQSQAGLQLLVAVHCSPLRCPHGRLHHPTITPSPQSVVEPSVAATATAVTVATLEGAVSASSPASLALYPDCSHCRWALEVSGMTNVASRSGHILARRPTGHEARRIKRMERVLWEWWCQEMGRWQSRWVHSWPWRPPGGQSSLKRRDERRRGQKCRWRVMTRHGGEDIPLGLGWLSPVIEDFVFAAVWFDFADDDKDFSLVCAGCPFSPCHVSWAKLSSSHKSKSWPLGPQKVTVFGDSSFIEVIELKWGHYREY